MEFGREALAGRRDGVVGGGVTKRVCERLASNLSALCGKLLKKLASRIAPGRASEERDVRGKIRARERLGE